MDRFKKVIVIAVVAVLLFVASFLVYGQFFTINAENCYDDMANTMSIIRGKVSRFEEGQAYYDYFRVRSTADKEFFEKKLREQGKTEAEIHDTIADTYPENDSKTGSSVGVDDMKSAVTGISKNVDCFIMNLETGYVVASGSDEWDDMDVDFTYTELPFGADESLAYDEEYSGHGIITNPQNGSDYYSLTTTIDNYLVSVCTPLSNMYSDCLKSVFMTMVMITALLVILISLFFKAKHTAHAADVREGKIYFNKRAVSSTVAFVPIALLIAVFFASISCQVTSYAFQNTVSKERMELLDANIKANESDRNVLAMENTRYNINSAKIISDLVNNDKSGSKAELLSEIKSELGLSEITLYNGNGISVETTTGYKGFKLSTNENDAIYGAWAVLTSDETGVCKPLNNESHEYFTAVRRKDAPGILFVKAKYKEFDGFLEMFSDESAIRGTDFGTAMMFYVKTTNADNMYMMLPETEGIQLSNEKFPEEMLNNNYTGIYDIGGENYYINTLKSDTITIVSALPTNRVNDQILFSIIIVLVLLALTTLLIIVVSFEKKPNIAECVQDSAQDENEDSQKRKPYEISGTLKRAIKIAFWVMLVAFVCFMFIISGKNWTLVGYLLGGDWAKGFNIFALCSSIMIICFICVIIAVGGEVLELICRNLGPRGLTVGKMFKSVFKFAGIFVMLGFVLYQVGVDMTAILAGAGIIGVVVGIGAKETVGDLIAGLFLVFEGHIHVGDWVRVNDMRGEVIQIGARTSVIKKYNRELIISNSDLRNFTNLSSSDSCSWVTLLVDASEDINRIKEIIMDEKNVADCYERIPGLTGGPIFGNVEDAGANGIKICIMAFIREARVRGAERKLRLWAFETLRANGVKFGKMNYEIEVKGEKQQ